MKEGSNQTQEPIAAALSVCGGDRGFAAPWLCHFAISGGCGSAFRWADLRA